MKAIQVSSFGAPEVLRLTELPDPAPGPGEVAVDVTCAAVGLIDVFIRQGLDPALAVAVVPNGATAYLALTQIARMHDGERILVHGALGGLAAGFPGIARQLGASRVTGTVRASDLDAAQQAELPYDEIIDSAELPARLAGERFDIVIGRGTGMLAGADRAQAVHHGALDPASSPACSPPRTTCSAHLERRGRR
jgi:NADPH:quinone reductase-like Zn-dependent oxidoreductase